MLVAYGGVPSIIVTLGTLAGYRTWLIDYSESKTITADSLPRVADRVLPNSTCSASGELESAVVACQRARRSSSCSWSSAYLRWGRRMYAIGSNLEAARQAGCRPRVVLCVHRLGALAGLAGFMFLCTLRHDHRRRRQRARAGAVVAAAVVGGVNIFGGSGTVFGALLGAILINTLDSEPAALAEVSEFWRDAILGVLILLAVTTRRVIFKPPAVVALGARGRAAEAVGGRTAAGQGAATAMAEPQTAPGCRFGAGRAVRGVLVASSS